MHLPNNALISCLSIAGRTSFAVRGSDLFSYQDTIVHQASKMAKMEREMSREMARMHASTAVPTASQARSARVTGAWGVTSDTPETRVTFPHLI
jgi:hypothetical protein